MSAKSDDVESFVKDRCDFINTIGDVNLLPLTPQLPNCYMYTVIYSLSNLSKFINYSVNLSKPQFSYLFDHDVGAFNGQELQHDKRKFIIFWLNECFKYLLNLHKQQSHVDDFNQRYIDNFNIYDIFSCLHEFCPMAEEDASAFLEFLFENFNEVHSGKSTTASNTDGIESLFRTKINTSFECVNCMNTVKAPDDVWTIWRTSTENVHENENLIDAFFKPQALTPYSCEHCSRKESEARILTSVSGKLPLCLIIQIERMQFKDNCFFKSDKYLNFEENISVQNVEYSLKSVILHLGDGCVEGHYLVTVKKSLKNKPSGMAHTDQLWFVLDGDKYQCMLDINNDFVHKNAILLFYMQN